MTNIELRYMESVAANLPRIAKALERIADSVEKPKALLRIADAVRETASPVQVVNDPTTWVCPQPPRERPPIATPCAHFQSDCLTLPDPTRP